MQRNRPGRVTVVCKGCGASFDSIKSQIERRSGGKFHSRECWKEWRAANRQTRLEKLLKQQYQLTTAQYQELLKAQGGACGICQCSPEEAGQSQLVVDHDHVTGRVRGLLCQACNLGLGRFRDNPMLLRLAASYLDRQSAI